MTDKELQDFALAQFAAESYLDGLNGTDYTLERALEAGNNNIRNQSFANLSPDEYPGFTRMTGSQINRFEQTYDVVLQEANTWTGFSGTLLRNTATADYVLSFRSTEYQNENKGGDWTRDGLSGAAGDISTYGFAVAQIADAEAWFR